MPRDRNRKPDVLPPPISEWIPTAQAAEMRGISNKCVCNISRHFGIPYVVANHKGFVDRDAWERLNRDHPSREYKPRAAVALTEPESADVAPGGDYTYLPGCRQECCDCANRFVGYDGPADDEDESDREVVTRCEVWENPLKAPVNAYQECRSYRSRATVERQLVGAA